MYVQNFREDQISFLDSVERYLEKAGIKVQTMAPQQRLAVMTNARNTLYSYDAQIIGDVARRILRSNLDNDTDAQAFMLAFYYHAQDPAFITIVMKYLEQRNDPSLNGVVGAVLLKVSAQYIAEHKPKDKKDKKDDETTDEIKEIRHIQAAIERLLGTVADTVVLTCGNMAHHEALFVAACLAINSEQTIIELVKADLPVTAVIFDKIITDPSCIIKGALLLKKSDLPTKLSANQTAFLTSIKNWLFKKLNDTVEDAVLLYTYLVGVYGSVKPDLSPLYIQIKDCGTSYPNLLTVAKQITN